MTALDYTPRDYQAAGIDLLELVEQGGIPDAHGVGLFYEPGSGKTVTALTGMRPPYLVVAPKMVAQEVWTREAAKWRHTSHLRVALFEADDFEYQRRVTAAAIRGDEAREIVKPGTEEDQDFLMCADVIVERHELVPGASPETLLAVQADIYVVSRDHLYTLARLLGHRWPWKRVLVDESTMFKNLDSKRSKTMDWLVRQGLVEFLVLMTGTPSPKGLENLFAQVRLLDGGKRLGQHITHFRKKYMTPTSEAWNATLRRKVISGWRPKPGAREAVLDKIKDICLSVRADVWRKTEPPRTVERFVELPGRARELYREMERDCYLLIGDQPITADHAAVVRNKLLQMASGAVIDDDKTWHVVHDAKLDALEELIEELDGEPLVVVYWFKSTLARLKERFGKRLATTKTKGFLDRFGAGEIELLAIQPASAGHGLDGLQKGGHHIAVMDMFDDWELYQQVVSRLDRGGQQYQVTVHQILAAGTKDGEVAPVLADKGADQARVMEALKFRG